MVDLMKMGTGLVLGLVVILSFTYLIRDFSSVDAYNTTLSEEFNTSLTSFDSRFTETMRAQSQALNVSEGASADQTSETGVDVGAALSGTRQFMKDSLGVVLKVNSEVTTIIGVPAFFGQALITLFVLAIFIILLTIVFRVRPGI